MRRSLASILMSISSASGMTATVAAEVGMRPCVSVSGTRCTRWTPLSYFELGVNFLALDGRDDFFYSTHLSGRAFHHFEFPALDSA